MFGFPGYAEIIIVGIIGVLLFGNRLPSIARSIGSAIPQFKKGLQDVKDECDEAVKSIKQ